MCERRTICTPCLEKAISAKAVKYCGNFLIISFGFLLVMTVIFVTLPAIESSVFSETICNVTVTVFNNSKRFRQKCECELRERITKCRVLYPCLQVYAEYKRHDGSHARGMLVKDKHCDGKCSFLVGSAKQDCRTRTIVHRHIKTFLDTWGKVHQAYRCYYRKGDTRFVYLTNDAASAAVAVNASLWPFVGLVLGTAVSYFAQRIHSSLCANRRNKREEWIPLSNTEEI